MLNQHDEQLLQSYCADIHQWAYDWQIDANDTGYCEELLDIFKPFVVSLIHQHSSVEEMQQHCCNLHVLGQELVKNHKVTRQQVDSALQMISDSIDAEGGPFCRCIEGGQAQQAFDQTCCKLYHFLLAQGSVMATQGHHRAATLHA